MSVFGLMEDSTPQVEQYGLVFLSSDEKEEIKEYVELQTSLAWEVVTGASQAESVEVNPTGDIEMDPSQAFGLVQQSRRTESLPSGQFKVAFNPGSKDETEASKLHFEKLVIWEVLTERHACVTAIPGSKELRCHRYWDDFRALSHGCVVRTDPKPEYHGGISLDHVLASLRVSERIAAFLPRTTIVNLSHASPSFYRMRYNIMRAWDLPTLNFGGRIRRGPWLPEGKDTIGCGAPFVLVNGSGNYRDILWNTAPRLVTPTTGHNPEAIRCQCGEQTTTAALRQSQLARPSCNKRMGGLDENERGDAVYDPEDGMPTDSHLVPGKGRFLLHLDRQFSLMRSFTMFGSNIKTLHFSKVELFDLRMLCGSIEACPKLADLGVYDCELLHIGELIPILDYIHWVGQRRRAPFIKLDYGPKAWVGRKIQREGTRIVTPFKIEMDVQMVVMTTLLTAVLKATPMGIDLLFKDSALVKYAMLVPMRLGLMGVYLNRLKAYIRAERDSFNSEQFIMSHHLGRQLLATMAADRDRKRLSTKLAFFHMMRGDCTECGQRYVKYLLVEHPDEDEGRTQLVCVPCRGRMLLNSIDDYSMGIKRQLLDMILPRECIGEGDGTGQGQNQPEVECPGDMVAPVMMNYFVYSAGGHRQFPNRGWPARVTRFFNSGGIASTEPDVLLEACGTARYLEAIWRYQNRRGVDMDRLDASLEDYSHGVRSGGNNAWEDILSKRVMDVHGDRILESFPEAERRKHKALQELDIFWNGPALDRQGTFLTLPTLYLYRMAKAGISDLSILG